VVDQEASSTELEQVEQHQVWRQRQQQHVDPTSAAEVAQPAQMSMRQRSGGADRATSTAWRRQLVRLWTDVVDPSKQVDRQVNRRQQQLAWSMADERPLDPLGVEVTLAINYRHQSLSWLQEWSVC